MARTRNPDATPRQSYSPTMRAIDPSEIPALTRTNSKAAAFVREFLDSGAEAVVVENASKSFASSLKGAIKKDASLDADAFRRGDQLILKRGRAAEKVPAEAPAE